MFLLSLLIALSCPFSPIGNQSSICQNLNFQNRRINLIPFPSGPSEVSHGPVIIIIYYAVAPMIYVRLGCIVLGNVQSLTQIAHKMKRQDGQRAGEEMEVQRSEGNCLESYKSASELGMKFRSPHTSPLQVLCLIQ